MDTPRHGMALWNSKRGARLASGKSSSRTVRRRFGYSLPGCVHGIDIHRAIVLFDIVRYSTVNRSLDIHIVRETIPTKRLVSKQGGRTTMCKSSAGYSSEPLCEGKRGGQQGHFQRKYPTQYRKRGGSSSGCESRVF